MASNGKSRKRPREDDTAKQRFGEVPSKFQKLTRGEKPTGTYIQQADAFKLTPSRAPVEIDHMTPDSLHQPPGQHRQSGEGASLSKRLPAAAMSKLQHRRKLTTGSGTEVEHQRAYLLHAHHGFVPFAGPMQAPQDHYAAAVEIELRSSSTPATLFGQTTVHDPRTFASPSQLGVVPEKDALWGLDRQKELVQRLKNTDQISSSHTSHLEDVLTEQRAAVAQMYKKP